MATPLPRATGLAAAAPGPVKRGGLEEATQERDDPPLMLQLQPLDWWLTIPDAALRQEFDRSKTGTRAATDATLYLVAILYSVVKVWSWEGQDLVATVTHHAWFLTACGVVPSTFLLTLKHHPSLYTNMRTNLMTGFRLAIATGAGLLFHAIKPSDLWLNNAWFQRLMSQTPMSALMNMSLYVLPFQWHVWVQLVGTVVTSTWVGDLCASTKSSPQLESSINYIGWVIDHLIRRLSVLGLPIATSPLRDGEFSCWLVGLFTHLLLGFVVPTLALYIAEVVSKIAFLRRNSMVDSKTLQTIKMSRIIFACMGALIGSQCIWVGLKGVLSPLTCSLSTTMNPQ